MTLVDVALGDALAVLIDHRGKTPRKLGGDWVNHGHRVVSALNIKERRVDLNDHHYVDAAMYRRWMPTPLAAGDVLLTSEAPLGEVAYLASTEQWCVGQRLFGLRGKPGLLDGRYLYYLLQTAPVRQQILSRASGSTVLGIRQAELIQVRLQLPSVVEQLRIAETLGALDDKIESNRRLIRLSSEFTAASVRSAAAGASATDLPVAALARFVNGGAYTKGATGAGRMVLRIAELNSGPGGSTIYTELDVPGDKTARAGDLLMSWSGSLDIYRWTHDEAIINQHIFKVIPQALPAWLVHDRLKAAMPIFQSIAKDKATTMGHIQRGHLESTTVPMPPSEQIKRLDAQLGPLWDRVLLAEREIHTLAALRDALLPELLSGRIRVPEVGEAVESAIA